MGRRNPAKPDPLWRDDIFRIDSMSKPIVSVAAMLAYEPSSTWDYSDSTDVLGRVIEVASGLPLGALLKARLFEPLGMNDTGFGVTEPGAHARIAEPFGGDGITPAVRCSIRVGRRLWSPAAPRCASWSTAPSPTPGWPWAVN